LVASGTRCYQTKSKIQFVIKPNLKYKKSQFCMISQMREKNRQ